MRISSSVGTAVRIGVTMAFVAMTVGIVFGAGASADSRMRPACTTESVAVLAIHEGR